METRAKWTFMVYLAGDNNLSSAGEKDLREMRRVGSTPEVNVVAEFDRVGNDHETMRYHIRNDGADEYTESLGETDSGDPEVLLDFIRWAAARFPAERYALVLWNHGGGWVPEELHKVARAMDMVDYSIREANERSSSSMGRVLFRTTIKKILAHPSPAERAILSDDGTGHSLDTIELGRVLVETERILGQKLDLLGMDACLMSNLEVAYQARGFVRCIVASEENEPNDGWPYDVVLGGLAADPDQDAPDLAKHIVASYVRSYADRNYTGPVTQAALDVSQTEILTKALDAFSKLVTPRMSETRSWVDEALYRTQAHFRRHTLWDVAEVCAHLADVTDDDEVRQAAREVNAALQPVNSSFVIAEDHLGAKVERCGGITIYWPPRILHAISPYYKDVEFARKHQWLGLLEAYQGP